MNRHFLIPATVAAAIHAGLLFGVHPPKVAAATPSAKPPTPVINVVPFELEPPPPDDASTATRQASAERVAPSTPEPPPMTSNDVFVIKVPNVPSTPATIPVATIPIGTFGPPSDLPIGPGVKDGNILRAGDLDNSPRTRSQTAPTYPFDAKRDGRTGQVTVEFMVDESGGVLSPRVAESTDPVFNDSALRAVARWKFEPGRRDGRVVRFRMAVPIVFSLNND